MVLIKYILFSSEIEHNGCGIYCGIPSGINSGFEVSFQLKSSLTSKCLMFFCYLTGYFEFSKPLIQIFGVWLYESLLSFHLREGDLLCYFIY